MRRRKILSGYATHLSLSLSLSTIIVYLGGSKRDISPISFDKGQRVAGIGLLGSVLFLGSCRPVTIYRIATAFQK